MEPPGRAAVGRRVGADHSGDAHRLRLGGRALGSAVATVRVARRPVSERIGALDRAPRGVHVERPAGLRRTDADSSGHDLERRVGGLPVHVLRDARQQAVRRAGRRGEPRWRLRSEAARARAIRAARQHLGPAGDAERDGCRHGDAERALRLGKLGGRRRRRHSDGRQRDRASALERRERRDDRGRRRRAVELRSGSLRDDGDAQAGVTQARRDGRAVDARGRSARRQHGSPTDRRTSSAGRRRRTGGSEGGARRARDRSRRSRREASATAPAQSERTPSWEAVNRNSRPAATNVTGACSTASLAPLEERGRRVALEAADVDARDGRPGCEPGLGAGEERRRRDHEQHDDDSGNDGSTRREPAGSPPARRPRNARRAGGHGPGRVAEAGARVAFLPARGTKPRRGLRRRRARPRRRR